MIFVADWPVLRQSRIVPETLALDLPADVLDNYLYKQRRGLLTRQCAREEQRGMREEA